MALLKVYLHACLSPQNPNDPTILASWRRVAFVEEFFDIIKEVHCKKRPHWEQETVKEVFVFTCLILRHALLYCLSAAGIEGV